MIMFIATLILATLLKVATAQMAELEAAKAQWETLVIEMGGSDNMSYKYGLLDNNAFDQDGNPSSSFIVLVENGQVVEAEPVFFAIEDDESMYDPSNYYTVELMFDLIEKSINDPSTNSVSVVYDDTLGYPKEIMIIPAKDANADPPATVTNWMIDPMTIYTKIQTDLNTHYSMWNESAASNYDYTVQIGCFCTPEWTSAKRVEVRDDSIVAITDLETGNDNSEFEYPTVKQLFDNVQRAINEKNYIINVEYNDTWGYVTNVYFDIHPGIADDEISTSISDVEVLDQGPTTSIGDDDEEDNTGNLAKVPTPPPTMADSSNIGAEAPTTTATTPAPTESKEEEDNSTDPSTTADIFNSTTADLEGSSGYQRSANLLLLGSAAVISSLVFMV